MDLFRRKEYSFETPEIKKWLKGWLKTEKWSITDVVHFLQVNYNLEMPIHFANYDVLHATVDCIPVTSNPVVLQYYRKLPRDQVRIIVGDTTYCYNLGTKPNATLVGRVIKKADGSSIHAKYRSHDYTYKMYDDNLASEYRIRLFITDSEEFRENPDHQMGRKTANLILGDVYGREGYVCDTHCIRITGLLGITDGSKDPLKVENQLRKCIPPEESNDFCHRMVLHGRAVCVARRPDCENCTLRPYCAFWTGKARQ